MLFGISVKDLGYSEANIKAFHDAEYCMRVKGLRAVHLSTMAKGILKFYRSFEMERAGHVFDQFVEDMVAKGMDKYTSQGKQSTGSRYIFLHDAMDRTDDLARFKAEATNVLFAGRDTGAVLMSNVFWTLARNPGFWQKLQDEVATLNGDFPTYETLKNMKYLNNVLKEGRLYNHPNFTRY
jgi:cytochrome P450